MAAGFASAWLAPKLPRWLVVAVLAVVLAASVRRGRIERFLWIGRTLRRDAPGSVLIGEFASEEPGAGITFARELIDAIGAHVTLALTVQGASGDRRARSLVRLYERRLGFQVLARSVIGGDDVVLMVRPMSAAAAAPALHAVR